MTIDIDDDTRKDMTRAYWTLRNSVLRTGTYEFLLTLDEFITLWAPRWHLRRASKLVIARTRATGPYQIGNVRIDTRSNQVREMHAEYRKRREAQRAADRADTQAYLAERHAIEEAEYVARQHEINS